MAKTLSPPVQAAPQSARLPACAPSSFSNALSGEAVYKAQS
eukprot:CAMPEP_0179111800 /NCGR_PEP_ID=MMETSP0796-20121207/52234_1 /TAXON_ID=73915 /ORGANISM="Pyrodinium bahamense, Strain pbaha01" /LENGTH=40 /DNA_ID= /DNA_START= /DNA_END= /DNA_ORIENTATION=